MINSTNHIYHVSWFVLKDKIRNGKTSYGKNELVTLMSDILEETLNSLQDQSEVIEDEIR